MSAAPLAVDALLAFNLGLLSQAHCVGMCGGVVGALAFAVAPQAVAQRGMLPFALAYNGGRVCSYALAGAVLAVAGQQGALVMPGASGYLLLRVLAGLMLVAAGFSLLGGRGAGLVERLGQHAWQLLRRPGRALLPLRDLRAAWLFGMLWGWLPCAMVYAALLFAAAGAGSAGQATAAGLRGALVMAAFGLGTSPALVTAVFAANHARRGLSRPGVRRGAGVLLILLGLAYPLLDRLLGNDHAHHHGFGAAVTTPAEPPGDATADGAHAHHHHHEATP